MNNHARTIILAGVIALIAFAVGLASGIGGSAYLRTITADSVSASGVLRYELLPNRSASLLPPEGYYIESSVTGRVYIELGDGSQYVEKTVRAEGKLATICGPDGSPCFPLVQHASINLAP